LTLIDACKQNGYTIDANNEEAVTAVCKYFQQDNSKGLLLMGYYGTGKTWLMRLVNEFVSPVRIVSTEQILKDSVFNQDVPNKYLIKMFRIELAPIPEGQLTTDIGLEIECPYCFDELGGHNDRKLNIYGNEIYPMSLILKAHYEKQIKCHAITNYNLEDLEKLYGGEVIDRMKEMFTIVKFKGGSRRK
jgi:hypothetical protein